MENANNDTMSSVLSSVCLTEELADVYFRFPGDIRLPAHKMLLSLRSPVFKAMFYGTYPLEKGDVVIDDINDSIFRTFLRFLYTDQVTIDRDNVIFLMNIANKYQVTSLLSKCGSYLSECLSTTSACTIYRHARFFCINDLIQRSLSYIETNAETVFQDDDFLSLSTEDLAEILKSQNLNVMEVDVFRSVLRWADNNMTRNKQTINNVSRRQELLKDNILYLIAIPMLSMEDYTTVVLPTGILSDEEELQVFKAITMNGGQIPATKFDASPRKTNSIGIYELLQRVPGYADFRNTGTTNNLHEEIEIYTSEKIILKSVTIKPQFQWSVNPNTALHLHWGIKQSVFTLQSCSPNCVDIKLGDKAVEVKINEIIESNSAKTCTLDIYQTCPNRNHGVLSLSSSNTFNGIAVMLISGEIPGFMNQNQFQGFFHQQGFNKRNYMFTEKLSNGTIVKFNISGCHLVERLNFACK